MAGTIIILESDEVGVILHIFGMESEKVLAKNDSTSFATRLKSSPLDGCIGLLLFMLRTWT